MSINLIPTCKSTGFLQYFSVSDSVGVESYEEYGQFDYAGH